MTFASLLQAAGEAASQVAQAATQMESQRELSVFIGQIPTAFWVVWLVERLKKSELFPWISANSSAVNRSLGVLAALLSSAGINFAVQGTVLAGGLITISFPSLGHLLHFIGFDMARAYGVQQGFFKLLTSRTEPPR